MNQVKILEMLELLRAVVLSVFLISVGFTQTQTATKARTKQAEPSESNPEKGYLIDVTIAADEPCARDYVKALKSESGIEQRKMLADLQSVDCIKKLPGIYEALGYEATGVATAEAALALLEREPCSMLLTDVTLPKMSGIELVALALARYPQMPVVVASGYGRPSALDGVRVGYLKKPYQLADLQMVIEQGMQQNATT